MKAVSFPNTRPFSSGLLVRPYYEYGSISKWLPSQLPTDKLQTIRQSGKVVSYINGCVINFVRQALSRGRIHGSTVLMRNLQVYGCNLLKKDSRKCQTGYIKLLPCCNQKNEPARYLNNTRQLLHYPRPVYLKIALHH